MDDTIDRLDGIIGMKRREYEMSRFRKGDSGTDRIKISHFSDDDHIWIFTQDRAYPIREATELFSELSLMDERFFVLVDEFDRIFESDDMFLGITIDILEHSCHGRRFSTSGRTRDENDSFFRHRQIEKVLRKTDRLRLRDDGWDHSHSDRGASIDDSRDIHTESSMIALV